LRFGLNQSRSSRSTYSCGKNPRVLEKPQLNLKNSNGDLKTNNALPIVARSKPPIGIAAVQNCDDITLCQRQLLPQQVRTWFANKETLFTHRVFTCGKVIKHFSQKTSGLWSNLKISKQKSAKK
jgi:hypothetical protein